MLAVAAVLLKVSGWGGVVTEHVVLVAMYTLQIVIKAENVWRDGRP